MHILYYSSLTQVDKRDNFKHIDVVCIYSRTSGSNTVGPFATALLNSFLSSLEKNHLAADLG